MGLKQDRRAGEKIGAAAGKAHRACARREIGDAAGAGDISGNLRRRHTRNTHIVHAQFRADVGRVERSAQMAVQHQRLPGDVLARPHRGRMGEEVDGGAAARQNDGAVSGGAQCAGGEVERQFVLRAVAAGLRFHIDRAETRQADQSGEDAVHAFADAHRAIGDVLHDMAVHAITVRSIQPRYGEIGAEIVHGFVVQRAVRGQECGAAYSGLGDLDPRHREMADIDDGRGAFAAFCRLRHPQERDLRGMDILDVDVIVDRGQRRPVQRQSLDA